MPNSRVTECPKMHHPCLGVGFGMKNTKKQYERAFIVLKLQGL